MKIELTRSDTSWRASESVKDLTIEAIPNPTTLASALRTGAVDIAYGLPADVVTQLEANDFTTTAQPAGSAAITSLIADAEPKLADPRVREAINMAVNRDEFVEAALGGFGTPNGSQLLQKGYVGFDDSLPSFEYDLNRAKELVDEAGVKGSSSRSPRLRSSRLRPKRSPATSTRSDSGARSCSRTCRRSSRRS